MPRKYGGLKFWLSVTRDIYDKMRADLRLMKEEVQRIETSRAPKERSLQSLQVLGVFYHQTDCALSSGGQMVNMQVE